MAQKFKRVKRGDRLSAKEINAQLDYLEALMNLNVSGGSFEISRAGASLAIGPNAPNQRWVTLTADLAAATNAVNGATEADAVFLEISGVASPSNLTQSGKVLTVTNRFTNFSASKDDEILVGKVNVGGKFEWTPIASSAGDSGGGAPPGTVCDTSVCIKGSNFPDNTVCCKTHWDWVVDIPPFGEITLSWVSADTWETSAELDVPCLDGLDTYIFRLTTADNGDGNRTATLQLVAGSETGTCPTLCLVYKSCCFWQCQCNSQMELYDYAGGDMFDARDLYPTICLEPRVVVSPGTTSDTDCMSFNGAFAVDLPDQVGFNMFGWGGVGCDLNQAWVYVYTNPSPCDGTGAGCLLWVDTNQTWTCDVLPANGGSLLDGSDCGGSSTSLYSHRTAACEAMCATWDGQQAVGRTLPGSSAPEESVLHNGQVVLFHDGDSSNRVYWWEIAVEVYCTDSCYDVSRSKHNYWFYSDTFAIDPSDPASATALQEWLDAPQERTWTLERSHDACVDAGCTATYWTACSAEAIGSVSLFSSADVTTTLPPVSSGDCSACGEEGYGSGGTEEGDDTVYTTCCGDVAKTLTCAITDPSGNCPEAVTSVSLVWNNFAWYAEPTIGGETWQIYLQCYDNGEGYQAWVMLVDCDTVSGDGGLGPMFPSSGSCPTTGIAFQADETTATFCGCTTSPEDLTFTVSTP